MDAVGACDGLWAPVAPQHEETTVGRVGRAKHEHRQDCIPSIHRAKAGRDPVTPWYRSLNEEA